MQRLFFDEAIRRLQRRMNVGWSVATASDCPEHLKARDARRWSGWRKTQQVFSVLEMSWSYAGLIQIRFKSVSRFFFFFPKFILIFPLFSLFFLFCPLCSPNFPYFPPIFYSKGGRGWGENKKTYFFFSAHYHPWLWALTPHLTISSMQIPMQIPCRYHLWWPLAASHSPWMILKHLTLSLRPT